MQEAALTTAGGPIIHSPVPGASGLCVDTSILQVRPSSHSGCRWIVGLTIGEIQRLGRGPRQGSGGGGKFAFIQVVNRNWFAQ